MNAVCTCKVTNDTHLYWSYFSSPKHICKDQIYVFKMFSCNIAKHREIRTASNMKATNGLHTGTHPAEDHFQYWSRIFSSKSDVI